VFFGIPDKLLSQKALKVIDEFYGQLDFKGKGESISPTM